MRKYLFVFLSSFVICGTAIATDCNPGTYLISGQCVKCPKGKYNSNPKASFCNHCPSGFTTVDVGAADAKECIHYVDRFYVGGDYFSWPANISPETKVDTTYLSFQ